jgi:hypothetical protein
MPAQQLATITSRLLPPPPSSPCTHAPRCWGCLLTPSMLICSGTGSRARKVRRQAPARLWRALLLPPSRDACVLHACEGALVLLYLPTPHHQAAWATWPTPWFPT